MRMRLKASYWKLQLLPPLLQASRFAESISNRVSHSVHTTGSPLKAAFIQAAAIRLVLNQTKRPLFTSAQLTLPSRQLLPAHSSFTSAACSSSQSSEVAPLAPDKVYLNPPHLAPFFLFFILTLLGTPRSRSRPSCRTALHCTARRRAGMNLLRGLHWRNFCWFQWWNLSSFSLLLAVG